MPATLTGNTLAHQSNETQPSISAAELLEATRHPAMAREIMELRDRHIAEGNLVYDEAGNFWHALSPNGEESRLPESQWLFVRTEAFKSWFGDWQNDPEGASKVVDANGEPLQVWHESPQDFDTLDDKRIGSTNDGGYYGRGHYFFTNRNDNALGFYGGKGAKEYAGFLNVRNLLREDTPELQTTLMILYGNSDRESAIEKGFKDIADYKLGFTKDQVAGMYDEVNNCEGRFIGYQLDNGTGLLETGKHEIIVKEAKDAFLTDKYYPDGKHETRIPM